MAELLSLGVNLRSETVHAGGRDDAKAGAAADMVYTYTFAELPPEHGTALRALRDYIQARIAADVIALDASPVAVAVRKAELATLTVQIEQAKKDLAAAQAPKP